MIRWWGRIPAKAKPPVRNHSIRLSCNGSTEGKSLPDITEYAEVFTTERGPLLYGNDPTTHSHYVINPHPSRSEEASATAAGEGGNSAWFENGFAFRACAH